MPPKKVAELCRLCSLDKRAKIDIFEGEGEIRLLHSKISSCLPVKVLRNDKLPKRICEDCMYKVEMFNDFREATLKSEKELNKFLEEEEKAENEEKERMERENAASETSGDQGDGSPAKEPIVPVDVVIKTETDDVTMDEDEHILGLSDASDSGGGDSKKTEEISKEEDMMNSSDDNSGGEFINKEEDIDSDYEYPQNIQASTFVSVEVDNEQPGPSGLSSGVPSNTDAASSSATASTSATEQPSTSSENLMPAVTIVANSTTIENDPELLEGSTDGDSSVESESHVGSFLCETCGKVFRGNRLLTKHKRRHNTRRYPCPICTKLLKTCETLKNHIKLHNQEVRFTCGVCQKSFPTKSTFNIHMRMHNSEAPFKCQYCHKECYFKCHLESHENMHTREKLYICEICNAQYASQISLRSHRKMHDRDQFSCEICGKKFVWKQQLSVHILKHIEDPKFTCATCGKIVRSRQSLYEHNRIHTGEKPYVCEICGKCSRTNVIHKQHQFIHAGVKRYTCNVCDKSFTQSHNLTLHRRSHDT